MKSRKGKTISENLTELACGSYILVFGKGSRALQLSMFSFLPNDYDHDYYSFHRESSNNTDCDLRFTRTTLKICKMMKLSFWFFWSCDNPKSHFHLGTYPIPYLLLPILPPKLPKVFPKRHYKVSFYDPTGYKHTVCKSSMQLNYA